MQKSILAVFVIFYSLSLQVHGQLFFENQASSQNIGYSYKVDNVMGAGVSFCDFNGDGWDDITFATAQGDSIAFYQNNSGTFNQITLNVGDTSSVKAVNWVDIDNDGDKDFFLVSHNSSNRLYENIGNMELVDITSESNLDTTVLYNFGASWGDIDNDGFLDVYISTRIFETEISNMLYKNNGDNTFTDVTVSAGIRDTNSFSFCSAWFDYNNDGWLDIYSTADKYNYPNILYENNGDGTFTDVSVATNAYIFVEAMCTTVDDYNYDGWLDVYVSNTDSGNVLLNNNGDNTFTDTASGVGVLFSSIGWGSAFLDGENDGDLDLYVSGMGMGIIRSSSAFYENDGTGFFDAPSGIGFVGDSAMSFGNAIGDYNNDGYYDIVVSNVDSSAHLWQNGGGENNYLKILLQGTESNRDGIGSWIKVYNDGEPQIRYTLCGESFSSQFSNTEIIGLGSNTIVDSIEVIWLSGIIDRLYNTPVNQLINIVEGSTNLPPMTISYEGSNYICSGDSIELFVNEDYEHYSWSTSDTLPVITTTNTGLIICEAWNDYTDSVSAQIEIYNSLPLVYLGNDTMLCENETLLLDVGNEWNSIEWSDGSSMETLLVDSAGSYAVFVSDSINCFAGDTIVIEYEICTSISEIANDEGIFIYPNPSNGVVYITLDLQNESIIDYSLYDLKGQKQELPKTNLGNMIKLDLSGLSNGTYVILIQTDKRNIKRNIILDK